MGLVVLGARWIPSVSLDNVGAEVLDNMVGVWGGVRVMCIQRWDAL